MTDRDPWEGWPLHLVGVDFWGGWVQLDDLPPLPPAEPLDERVHWRVRKSRLSGRPEVWCGASLHTFWRVREDPIELVERRGTRRGNEVTCPDCIAARDAAAPSPRRDRHRDPSDSDPGDEGAD